MSPLKSLCVCCPDVFSDEYTNQSSPSFDVHAGNMWFLYFLLSYLRLVACGWGAVKRSLCITGRSVKIGRWVEHNPSGSLRSMSQSAWKIPNVILKILPRFRGFEENTLCEGGACRQKWWCHCSPSEEVDCTSICTDSSLSALPGSCQSLRSERHKVHRPPRKAPPYQEEVRGSRRGHTHVHRAVLHGTGLRKHHR